MSEAGYQNCNEAIHDETVPDLVLGHKYFVGATHVQVPFGFSQILAETRTALVTCLRTR